VHDAQGQSSREVALILAALPAAHGLDDEDAGPLRVRSATVAPNEQPHRPFPRPAKARAAWRLAPRHLVRGCCEVGRGRVHSLHRHRRLDPRRPGDVLVATQHREVERPFWREQTSLAEGCGGARRLAADAEARRHDDVRHAVRREIVWVQGRRRPQVARELRGGRAATADVRATRRGLARARDEEPPAANARATSARRGVTRGADDPEAVPSMNMPLTLPAPSESARSLRKLLVKEGPIGLNGFRGRAEGIIELLRILDATAHPSVSERRSQASLRTRKK
jgi:hypothetical protein